MKCPHCKADTKGLVLETRRIGEDIGRRRVCAACNGHYVTRELFDPEFVLRDPKPKSDRAKPKRTNNNDLFKVWGRA